VVRALDRGTVRRPRARAERGIDTATVQQLIDKYTTGRTLGFMGQPAVNVVQLNIDLDQHHPYRG
jgi:potassium-transporting ATPase KdpC subunit